MEEASKEVGGGIGSLLKYREGRGSEEVLRISAGRRVDGS